MSFATKLQNLRAEYNLTQNELADKINVSQKTISSWETGRTDPTIADVENLALVFGRDLNYFANIETRVTEPVFPINRSYGNIPPKELPSNLETLTGIMDKIVKLPLNEIKQLQQMIGYILLVHDKTN